MTDKELRKLSRAELLELLIEQSKENQELRRRLEEAEKELNDRKLKIAKAGSLAEAALALSDVFKKADEAAQLYLENLKRMSDPDGQEQVTDPLDTRFWE